MPVTSASTPSTRADRLRDRRSSRSVGERGVRACVGAVAGERDRRRSATVLVRADGRRRPAADIGPWRAPALELVDARAGPAGAVTSVGLDDDDRRQRAAGERRLDAVVGLHDRQVARQARRRPELTVCMFSAGSASASRIRPTATTETTGRASTRSRIAAPDARLAVVAMARAADERHAALLDPVAELGQQRGQDGERAEHRDRDDEHRADGERREHRVAGEEHAGHGDHHGQAGDRARRGRRSRRRTRAPPRRAAGVALLHLAPQVEHRVVDADGEADQQHDRVRSTRRPGSSWLIGPSRPSVADDGGEREQQRHAGGDERAERDDQDQQRDRQREELGLLEVVLEGLRRAPCRRWRRRTARCAARDWPAGRRPSPPARRRRGPSR